MYAGVIFFGALDVDFDSQVVLVSTVHVGATCGVGLDFEVVDNAGSPLLMLDVTNPTGACRVSCEGIANPAIAVVVDATGTPATCGTLRNTCTK